MENLTYDSLVKEILPLLKANARGKPPRITLSTETATLLESVTEAALEGHPSPEGDTQPSVDVHTPVLEPDDTASAEKDGRRTLKEDTPMESIGDETLERIIDEISTCQKCPLGKTRLNTVPGEGNPQSPLVFVGEAPGESEDRQGRPFVGRAGQLLTDIITKGMKLRREDVYICNVLKCRPPENRTPNPEEVMLCEPYLLRQLAVIRPKVICALGAVAARTLLKTNSPLSGLRGIWHDYHGVALRVTYHPAYLLRNPADKVKTWEDIQEIMRYLKG